LKRRLLTVNKKEEVEKKETTKAVVARWNNDGQGCFKDRAKK
jgi:hypothetical protein